MEKYMNITDVRVRKVARSGKMKAVVSITIDDVFVVHDIKVIEGSERLFVAMPSRRDEQGSFRDICHPITAEARQTMEDKILAAYREHLEEASRRRPEGEERRNDLSDAPIG